MIRTKIWFFSKNASGHERVKQLQILKFNDIFNLKQLIFYYKFKKNSLPNPIKDILIEENRELRTCHTAFFLKPPPLANTESAKLCIRYSIPSFINAYDKKFIENITSVSILTMKNKFKNYTFNSYYAECNDQSCYACTSRFFNCYGLPGSLKFLHLFYYLINFKFHRPFLVSGILSFLNVYSYLNSSD